MRPLAGRGGAHHRRRCGDGRDRRRRGPLLRSALSLPLLSPGRRQVRADPAGQPEIAPAHGRGADRGAAQAARGLGQPLPGAGPGPALTSARSLELEIRPIRPEELPAYSRALRRTFGAHSPRDEELELSRLITEFDRTLAAFDGGEVVATAGIFSFQIAVPGGRSLGCAGITRVTVLPTHRRRGLLTAMMRRMTDEAHARGEPLAALFASEAPIYGRFGYGVAAYDAPPSPSRLAAEEGCD
ncbi:MAG: GNAT family N-acetyltransferase [Chloroflexi bacterium]|nr:MAG: GNAT family N-acetyltransferase [Chloroflexota bacterium]